MRYSWFESMRASQLPPIRSPALGLYVKSGGDDLTYIGPRRARATAAGARRQLLAADHAGPPKTTVT